MEEKGETPWNYLKVKRNGKFEFIRDNVEIPDDVIQNFLKNSNKDNTFSNWIVTKNKKFNKDGTINNKKKDKPETTLEDVKKKFLDAIAAYQGNDKIIEILRNDKTFNQILAVTSPLGKEFLNYVFGKWAGSDFTTSAISMALVAARVCVFIFIISQEHFKRQE